MDVLAIARRQEKKKESDCKTTNKIPSIYRQHDCLHKTLKESIKKKPPRTKM